MNLFKNITGHSNPPRRVNWRAGETIAETIIALSVLAIGITLSSVLMSNSLRNMNSSKSRVVAVNIAREGIEAVRNIRDTNWLKFSSRRRTCWNHMPLKANSDTCAGDGSDLIPAGDYIVYKDEAFRWRLVPKILAGEDLSRVYLVDIDTSKDTSGDGVNDNDQDIYNHPKTHTGSGEDSLGRAHSVATGFQRTIRIDYLRNDGSILSTATASSENRMLVTATVIWGQDTAHQTQLTTHLSDYLGRDNLN